MRIAALPLLLSLAACALPGGFPSLQLRPAETPRQLDAPGAAMPAALSTEERESLAADLARAHDRLATIEAAIRTEAAALDRQLARANRAVRGTAAWSDAQMQLTRFDSARLPLDDLRADLTPLLLMVDSLDAGDPDRQAVAALQADLVQASEAAARQVEAVNRALGD